MTTHQTTLNPVLKTLIQKEDDLNRGIVLTFEKNEEVSVMDVVDGLGLPFSKYWLVRRRLDKLVKKGFLSVRVKRVHRYYSVSGSFRRQN
jgi:hypothetical protein